MDARSYTLLTALAFAATGLAGCIEAPAFLNVSDVEVSALEYRDVAHQAALEWNAKAMLVGVMAFELTESEEARIAADPDVGNGLAPAWWYVYTAKGDSAGDIRAFRVNADGSVLAEEDAEAFAAGYDHDMVHAIAEWNTDSSDAIATAKGDESFRKVAEGFNASIVEGVAHHEGVSAWWIAAMSADGFVVANVNAVTGELISVDAIDMDMHMPDFEFGARDPSTWEAEPIHMEGAGELASGDKETYEFTLDAPMSGMLHLRTEGGLIGESFRWAILDEEGEAYAEGYASAWRESEEEIDLSLDAGDYTLVIGYGGWVPIPLSEGEYMFELYLEPGHSHGKKHEH